jgi:hypothetical protein
MEITMQDVITILSIIAAIVAWLAKILWSKEFKEAKEAQILSLEQQVKTLRDLTPDRLRKILEDSAAIYEEGISQKENEIDKLKSEKDSNAGDTGEVQKLENEIAELKNDLKLVRETAYDIGNVIIEPTTDKSGNKQWQVRMRVKKQHSMPYKIE